MTFSRTNTGSSKLASIMAIGLVTHRFLKCKRCGKATSHRYDLVTGEWKCLFCGELREESEDHLFRPSSTNYLTESVKSIIRAITMLILVFVLAYILMFYLIP
ncbi:MAG: hypothetical protein R6U44_10340 [Archaeoglobaceae archaeon]